LRARDLIWSRAVKAYLLGRREVPNDLGAWNNDTTRMPARMHSEYLRELFLHNDLAEGRYQVEGRAVALADISVPVFAVGTETDHVAPWKSVYKIHGLTPADVTFVLTSGGHNAGIVSEPGHPHRHYRVADRAAGAATLAPDDWFTAAPVQAGSWWPAWSDWLAQRSSAADQAPPPAGTPDHPALADAPGSYILEQ
jgi:polyhydroxyalkanoate synthase